MGKIAVQPNILKQTQTTHELGKLRNMFQKKEQDNSPSPTHIHTKLNETQKTDLPARESKVMIIKMFAELWKSMDVHRVNFSKEIENI